MCEAFNHSKNLLVTQDIRANRAGNKTSDRAQSSTTKLVAEECAASASNEGGA